jgi:hypothetical protein
MKVVKGKFNDLSEELMKRIPKLKRGEQITFTMLNGLKNPDSDPDEQKKRPMLYPKQNLPMNDYIKDLDGTWKHIVVADSWDGDKPLRERFFMPGLDLGGLFNGKFTLVGGNAKDEELYEFLCVTNYNESSVLGENKDETKPSLFKQMNLKAEAKETTNKIAILRKALDLAVSMDEKDAQEFAASLNWSVYTEWVELQAKVVDFARTNPDEFLKYYQDPQKVIKAQIKTALDKGIITYDLNKGEVKMGDNSLVVLKKEDRNNFLNTFALWFNTAKNGKSILEQINQQLAEKKEAVLF